MCVHMWSHTYGEHLSIGGKLLGWVKENLCTFSFHIGMGNQYNVLYSRWIREVLSLSGIDVNTFKAGSSRSASSSAEARCGASPQQIVKHGDWSNLGTYQRFYNRELIDTPVGRLILSTFQCKFSLF